MCLLLNRFLMPVIILEYIPKIKPAMKNAIGKNTVTDRRIEIDMTKGCVNIIYSHRTIRLA